MTELLIDMDSIMVDMIQTWLDKYGAITGEFLDANKVGGYRVRKTVQRPDILDDVLNAPGFFADLPIMPGCQKYFQKLVDEGYDITILTKDPRSSDFAVRDKRIWVAKYFPNFDTSNITYAHKKHQVCADVLFDDAPYNLEPWMRKQKHGISATITYEYNKHVDVDWRFDDKRTAWKEFYEAVKSLDVPFG